ncbi:MAG: PQQ-like beta-propeller repeat protein [Deltaproteobacteria bacterium]|nr:PQQ-like beta-propeller repeat protein [Deltaproteobacteria bacterium]
MASFEIVVGQHDRPLRPGAAKVDPARHRDVIDIFVDGANVSARAPADRVYPLIRELAGAVVDLANGNREKVVVPFHEAPYELVLERQGDHALVTFYRGGNAPEVSVKDRPVPLDELKRAVSSAAKNLCDRLWNDEIDDPRRAELLALSERTGDPRFPSWPDGVSRLDRLRRIRSRHFVDSPKARAEDEDAAALAFGFEAQVPATRASATGGVRADLHSLLFRGRLSIHVGGSRTTFSEGYLFLRLERLVQACRHLAEASEAGRAMAVRLESDGFLIGVRLESDGRASLSLSETAMPVPVVVRGSQPIEIVDAVASVTRELRRVLVAVGEGKNLRVRELTRSLTACRASLRSMAGECAVECSEAEAYRALAAGGMPRPDETSGSLASARRLGFAEKWRLEAEGLDLAATFLCGDRLIVTAKRSLCALDRDSGEMVWRVQAPRATTLVAGDGVMRLRPDGRATMHAIEDGEPRWSIDLQPRAGGAPIGVAPAGLDAPPLAVVAEGKRTLTGLDLRTGERRWLFQSRRHGAFRIRRTGRLLHVICGDPAVYAIDLTTGELVWRYTGRDRFKDRPVLVKDALLAFSGQAVRDGGGGRELHAMDAFSGRPLWTANCGSGGSADAPIAVAGAVVVPAAGPEGMTFIGIDASTGARLWERALPEAAPGHQSLGVDDLLVVNTALGRVLGIDATTGETVWSTDMGRVRDVPRRLEPVLRGGALFVPSQSVAVLRPRDGQVIHRLSPDTPIPDFLRVDERYALYVGEDSGLLVCYSLGARLALVRS